MSRRRIWRLLLVNFGLILLAVFLRASFFKSSNKHHRLSDLQFVNSLLIQCPDHGCMFSLERSNRTGEWMVLMYGNTWKASYSAVEDFYERLKSVAQNRDPARKNRDEKFYEVIVSSKEKTDTLSFTPLEMLELLRSSEDENGDIEDGFECFPKSLLSESMFHFVQEDCRVVKIERGFDEFVFCKRDNQWFLDSPASDLSISDGKINSLLAVLLTGKPASITLIGDERSKYNLAITMYNEALSEKVGFLAIDDEHCLGENPGAGLLFGVPKKLVADISEAVDGLLKFHVFEVESCTDINVFLDPSSEQFSFHSLDESRWQFTYVKDEKLVVKEIGADEVETLLKFLNSIESMSVVPGGEDYEKYFSLKLNEFSGVPRVFNFYKKNGHLFVEVDGQQAKFELKTSFVPILFHIIRANLLESGVVL